MFDRFFSRVGFWGDIRPDLFLLLKKILELFYGVVKQRPETALRLSFFLDPSVRPSVLPSLHLSFQNHDILVLLVERSTST